MTTLAAAFPDVKEDKKGSQGGTQEDGDDGGFGTEGPAGEDIGPLGMHFEEGVAGVVPGDGKAEDIALGVVPGPMDADRKPQRPEVFICRAQQQSGLDGDGQGRPPGGVVVADMDGSENEGRYRG